jgi:hypothetical protein
MLMLFQQALFNFIDLAIAYNAIATSDKKKKITKKTRNMGSYPKKERRMKSFHTPFFFEKNGLKILLGFNILETMLLEPSLKRRLF